jgi:hypothetical protein
VRFQTVCRLLVHPFDLALEIEVLIDLIILHELGYGCHMTPMPHIHSYQFGKIQIDDLIYTDDIIILPNGKIIASWWRKQGHFMTRDDIFTLLNSRPDKLIIGTGSSGGMKVDPKLISYLSDNGIETIIHRTQKAVQMYNRADKPDDHVGACFHLTC